jgi:3-(3-hydroxy-phenyl)propionate hydroxylase
VSERDGAQREIEAQYSLAAGGGRIKLRDLVSVTLPGSTHPIKWLVVEVRNAELDASYTALHRVPAVAERLHPPAVRVSEQRRKGSQL